MRYSIHGFSQVIATNLKLNNDDLLILRWLVDFTATGKMDFVEIDKKIYYWVNYKTLCDDLPILKMKKDTVYRRMKKMCNCDVLEHTTVKKGGSYSYYGFGSKYSTLVSDINPKGVGYKSVGGTDENPGGVRMKIPNKDSSINDSSINNKNNSPFCPYKDLFDYYMTKKLKKHRSYTKGMTDAIKKAMRENKYDFEECKKLIDRHEVAVLNSKDTEYSVTVRGLDEFFGQKVYRGTHLICSEYEVGGSKYDKYFGEKPKIKKGLRDDGKDPFADVIIN